MSGQTNRTQRGAQAAPREPESTPTPAKNRPVQTIRIGSIKAAIWANDGSQGGVFYSVTFVRVYKDGQGQWQTADTFGRDDLLVLAKVADLAHSWIVDTLQAPGGE